MGHKTATLPFPRPFSVNDMYVALRRQGHGDRGKTLAYRRWRDLAMTTLVANGPRPQFVGPVAVTVTLGEIGVTPNFDTDNALKPIFDVLVKMGVIPDDRRITVRRIVTEWAADLAGCTVQIETCGKEHAR